MITEKQKYNLTQLSIDDQFEILETIIDSRCIVQYHDYKRIMGYKKSRQSFYNELKNGTIKGRMLFGNWYAIIY
jgi:hypothetical protein